MTSTYAIIAGGGTAGHINPALAVADALVDRGHAKESIFFVGSKRGLESRLVPETGYRFKGLSGRGIVRKVNKDAALAVVGLLKATLNAIALVRAERPAVIVSVGGYASAPCSIAAVLLRVPLILVESNASPGAANRLVSRMAKASAVALPGTPLPRASVTGNPVRKEFIEMVRTPETVAAARTALGIPLDRVVVGAFGGSLGAGSINRAVSELAVRWTNRDEYAIYHVLGSRDWNNNDFEKLSTETFGAGGLHYNAVEYEKRMAELFLAADVLVCRAGATTVAEAAAAGCPAVFVPLPGAPGDHQTANATALANAGAAVVVKDSECTGARLEVVLAPIVGSATRREEMATAAVRLAVPDAADRVARLVEANARVQSDQMSDARGRPNHKSDARGRPNHKSD